MAVFDIEIRASTPAADAAAGSVAAAGYWAALLAFVGVAAFGVVQLAQVFGLVGAPLDAILIDATSLTIAPPFAIALLALHYCTPAERRFFSHAAVNFAVMYAVFAVLIYVVQLGSVIPASLRGEDVAILEVTPHSLFWTVDALAYICLGVATLFAVPALDRHGPDRLLWWLFLANGLLTPVLAVVYFYPTFSVGLLFLGSPWLITAGGSALLLAGFFRRRGEAAAADRAVAARRRAG